MYKPNTTGQMVRVMPIEARKDLEAAIRDADLDLAKVAEVCGCKPRTVNRWVATLGLTEWLRDLRAQKKAMIRTGDKRKSVARKPRKPKTPAAPTEMAPPPVSDEAST